MKIEINMSAKDKSLAHQRLAQMARRGDWGDKEVIQYVNELERELSKFAPTHMAEVWRENERLRSGNFTEDEFQNLCHNFQDEDMDRFADGCISYMEKLFGRCPLVRRG